MKSQITFQNLDGLLESFSCFIFHWLVFSIVNMYLSDSLLSRDSSFPSLLFPQPKNVLYFL